MQNHIIVLPRTLRLVLSSCALVIIATIPALAAPVTFAQYVQVDGAQQQWTNVTSGTTTTITSSGSVFFSFSGISGLPFSGPEAATFSFSATSNSIGNCGVSCAAGDSYVEPGFSGTFSFIDNGVAPGTNLLSGTFAVLGDPATSGGEFAGHLGSGVASFTVSSDLTQLVLTSAYVNLLNQIQEDASWSSSSFRPNFSVGTVTDRQAYPSPGPFTASGTGTFSADPGPTLAPEPATFAMIGGGMVGLAFLLRRKSRSE